MFILRCAVLLAAALTLSNCCLSSSGCSSGPVALTAAPAPGAPGPVAAAPAWDGLNDQSAADDDATVDVTPPKKASRRSKAACVAGEQFAGAQPRSALSRRAAPDA